MADQMTDFYVMVKLAFISWMKTIKFRQISDYIFLNCLRRFEISFVFRVFFKYYVLY